MPRSVCLPFTRFARRTLLFPLALTAAVISGGCGNNSNSGGTTAPTPIAITETFDGTLTVNGGVTHPFAIQQAGTITATLANIDPADGVVGLSLGTWNGVSCAIVLANDNAVLAVTVTGAATATGTYCARIYDTGKLTSPAAYEITVVHF